jgi:phosphatidyl-myo-inositol dimannoside synthase
LKILFLTLHTFSLTGGIEKVSRSICKVLTDLYQEKKIDSFHVMSMYDQEANTAYLSAQNFTGFNTNRISFSLSTLLKSKHSQTIILSHINLLFFALIIKKLAPSKRVILMAHGIEVWGVLKKWKLNFLKKHCEIWAVSNFTAQQLLQKQIPEKNIKVLNNCLDPYFNPPISFVTPTNLLEKYQLSVKQPILFTLTRISSQEQYKGYDKVIQLLPKLIENYPTLHYILAGKADEIEKAKILNLIKDLKLEQHVTLTGYLEDEEINNHFLLADAFVMPSVGEGFGISFIEAAACGCLSVAGNVDGSKDALMDGKLGTLIDPSDQLALEKAINETLETPKTYVNKEALQAKCLTKFRFENYKMNILTLLIN